MKYTINDFSFFSHYRPKRKMWKVVLENMIYGTVIVFVGIILAYSIVMFGTN